MDADNGQEYLPPEEWDLQGFMILPCVFKPRVMVCGRGLKTILLLLFLTRLGSLCSSNWGSDPSVSHVANSRQHMPQRVCSPHVTTPGLPKTPPMCSVTPLTTALRSCCHPARAKGRHPTHTKVYRVGEDGDVVCLCSNSHFRGSSDCAPGKVLQPEAHMRDLQLCTLLLL